MTKHPRIVGLDIGAASIKAVQVSFDSKGSPKIEKVGKIATPTGSVYDGLIQEKDKIADTLKTLWKEAKFNTNVVRVGVGGRDVITSTADLNYIPDADFKKALPFIAAEQVYGIDNDYYLDYHTLSIYQTKEPSPDDPEELLDVNKRLTLVAGAKKETVDSLIDVLFLAKLKPISVDINSLALIRAYDTSVFNDEEETVDLSVDIGADNTTIVLHKLGQPLYIREISNLGGLKATKLIKEQLGTDMKKAEFRKLESLYSTATEDNNLSFSNSVFNAGEPQTEAISPRTAEEESQIARNKIISPIVQEINSEIISVIIETINDFKYSPMGEDLRIISGVLLSGGTSISPGLSDRIAAELKTQTVIGNPFNLISLNRGVSLESFHDFTIAVGVATKGAKNV